MFWGCSLPIISIPDGVTTIGSHAFYGCDVFSITIPDSVTSIGENAFDDCFSLKGVCYGGTRAQWDQISISDGNQRLTNAAIAFGSAGAGIP